MIVFVWGELSVSNTSKGTRLVCVLSLLISLLTFSLTFKKKRLFKTFSYKKNAKEAFLKHLRNLKKRLKNTRRFDVLGRHYQVKK